MKMWLTRKINQGFLVIVVMLALVYNASFFSPFFQDDFILLKLSTEGPLFAVIPGFPLRPLAIQFFYNWSHQIFGTNVFGYHLVLFAFFAGGLYFALQLARQLLASQRRALLAIFFFAVNVSLFPNFYWIAVSYFSMGIFFFFGTLYFFQKPGRLNLFLSLIFFILAVGCNEISFVLPVLLLLICWYKKKLRMELIPFWVLLPVLFVSRIVLAGVPEHSAYTLKFDLQVFATLRWYIFRALNLPEGVQRSDPFIYIFFVSFIVLISFSLFSYFLKPTKNVRLLIFSVLFFLIGAAPFFFLPGHMSSYYLTMALFGPALFFAEVLHPKIFLPAILVYLALTILGLEFLSQTHWIILKPNA